VVKKIVNLIYGLFLILGLNLLTGYGAKLMALEAFKRNYSNHVAYTIYLEKAAEAIDKNFWSFVSSYWVIGIYLLIELTKLLMQNYSRIKAAAVLMIMAATNFLCINLISKEFYRSPFEPALVLRTQNNYLGLLMAADIICLLFITIKILSANQVKNRNSFVYSLTSSKVDKSISSMSRAVVYLTAIKGLIPYLQFLSSALCFLVNGTIGVVLLYYLSRTVFVLLSRYMNNHMYI
jgi:hypothetical protein